MTKKSFVIFGVIVDDEMGYLNNFEYFDDDCLEFHWVEDIEGALTVAKLDVAEHLRDILRSTNVYKGNEKISLGDVVVVQLPL